MLDLPFKISKSLASYAEQFNKDPAKATERLEKQLDKRGPDAVGYFLLAWFYHLRDMREQAVEEALRARIYAPGSYFFRKLHYFLSHPQTFEAWTPDPEKPGRAPSGSSIERRGPSLDLDALIQKLSDVKTHRIKTDEASFNSMDTLKENKKDKDSSTVDDIVSETLAKIHEKQGKIDTAIRSYQQLKRVKKEKSDYFEKQISRLQKIKRESTEEE